ncbi:MULTISPECIES: DUF6463 family protein [unclassified Mycobacterium]|uniref:DUF6463 family protein n=1 Tax=unclassified Mycobacterium TaxID=2642494 RepID=UPI0007402405|nr:MULTISPECIES: DUF6463 family protein [unclassified Mycobacterium]KUH85137.1 hypothetical protein AU185_01360 [Mycobacterium sp. GA-0227b]KUH87267.1 hypothetical protein AU186_01110 [Mycobacterium sp. GA-1999]KUH90562.1 hypothetical protein AU187_24085 [Mycobacterium sp. IS-1556]
MTEARTKRLGEAVIATGVLHDALGGYLYRRQLAGMARDGLLNSASDARLGTVDGERRHTAFWFLIGGLAFITMGASIRRSGASGEPIAPALGPGMAAMGAIGAAVMPVSGFWLLLVEGLAAMALRRHQRQ